MIDNYEEKVYAGVLGIPGKSKGDGIYKYLGPNLLCRCLSVLFHASALWRLNAIFQIQISGMLRGSPQAAPPKNGFFVPGKKSGSAVGRKSPLCRFRAVDGSFP